MLPLSSILADKSPEDYLKENKPYRYLEKRYDFWHVGIGVAHSNVSVDVRNDFSGDALSFNLGKNLAYTHWYIDATVYVLSGPYKVTINKDMEFYFRGVGGSFEIGYSPMQIRDSWSMGIITGMRYERFTGEALLKTYIMQISKIKNNFSMLSAGIFVNALNKQKTITNQPKDLTTFLAGFLMSFNSDFFVYVSNRNWLPEFTEKKSSALNFRLRLEMKVFFRS